MGCVCCTSIVLTEWLFVLAFLRLVWSLCLAVTLELE